ncbi:hypothetical protein [Burkholderia metallica]|uniref:hypothetical protein n=1 Tax=Burkholderia metallica TaxID=488729 RepID=UPI001CF33187|nr:hypothetical protein [Burkholderia metallica]MCA8023586.1 hypothetical protein [Burkholderia metallica]
MNIDKLIVVASVFMISVASFANGMPESKYSNQQEHVRAETSPEVISTSIQDGKTEESSLHTTGAQRQTHATKDPTGF